MIAVILVGQNYLLGAFHFLTNAFPEKITALYVSFHVFLGKFALVASVLATCTGIQYVTYGCGAYEVNGEDVNPAQNYVKLKEGCKLAYGIGLLVIFGLSLVLFGTQGSESSLPSGGSATDRRPRHGPGPSRTKSRQEPDVEMETLYEL